MLFISGYLSEEVIKYSILEDLILVIRQSDGPAIKGVSVAERMEAGAMKPNRGRVPAPAGMSEAWRGFCRLGTRLV
jgi:hypothetical protein